MGLRQWIFFTGARLLIMLAIAGIVSLTNASAQGRRVLIVMDERDQMLALARFLKQKADLDCLIVDQSNLPADWAAFTAVIGYIHMKMDESTARGFIDYTKKGGRLVLLHHSISSAKATNQEFFDFLGIELTEPEKARDPSTPGGHYAWKEPVTQVIVNLRPSEYITSNGITWPETTRYTPSDAPSSEGEFPALALINSEIYLNHKFTDGRAKTVLLGFKWGDERNGQLYMQDRSAWYKRQGAGWIFYLQPGHSQQELENPIISQIILNAIEWRP